MFIRLVIDNLDFIFMFIRLVINNYDFIIMFIVNYYFIFINNIMIL
jgi:hypothetical protein